jgi:hypothetical protein
MRHESSQQDSRRGCAFAFAALLTLLALAPSVSWATKLPEHRPWELTLSPVYAYLVVDGSSETRAGGAAAQLTYMLSESVGLRAGASWTLHDLEATQQREGGVLRVWSANVGLSYALDLLRARPAIELGAGILHSDGPNGNGTDLGVMIGLALDYALYDWLTVGAALHYHGFLTDVTSLPVYVTLGPRVGVRL